MINNQLLSTKKCSHTSAHARARKRARTQTHTHTHTHTHNVYVQQVHEYLYTFSFILHNIVLAASSSAHSNLSQYLLDCKGLRITAKVQKCPKL